MALTTRAWRALVLLGALAAALAFVALASGSKRAGAEPIRIMVTAPVVSNQANYPEITFVANFYEKWVNSKGGINGHPLDLVTCDSKNEANATAACGREAVAKNVVAVVGSWSPLSDKIVPILEKAGIAWFGQCCPASNPEYQSKVSFPVGTILLTGGGAAVAAKFCKKPAVILQDLPYAPFFVQIYTTALKGQGVSSPKFVKINPVPTDYSPQVAEATTGTDCILGALAEGHWTAWLPAQKQAGQHQRIIGYQGNLNPHVAERFPDMTQNALSFGVYPVLSDPSLKLFRQLWDQAKAPKSYDESGLGAEGTWVGLRIFQHVVEKMKGPITKATFLAAASRTKATNSDGIVPSIDFTKPLGVKGFPRTFNKWMSVAIIKNGKFHSFGTKRYVDILPAWTGKKVNF